MASLCVQTWMRSVCYCNLLYKKVRKWYKEAQRCGIFVYASVVSMSLFENTFLIFLSCFVWEGCRSNIMWGAEEIWQPKPHCWSVCVLGLRTSCGGPSLPQYWGSQSMVQLWNNLELHRTSIRPTLAEITNLSSSMWTNSRSASHKDLRTLLLIFVWGDYVE